MPISNDRTLVLFHQNMRDFLVEVMAIGFDDLEELAAKIRGMREEIEHVERRALALTEEQAERTTEAPDSGWVADHNRGAR